MSGWQMGLIFLGLASIALCALVCLMGYYANKRREILPPPQKQVYRSANREHAHCVGNMRGVR